MNIDDLKVAISTNAGISITKLDLTRQFEDTAKTKPTEWLGYWDNDKRVRISVHQDVVATITKDRSFSGLSYKKEAKVSKSEENLPYMQYVIITPLNIEASF